MTLIKYTPQALLNAQRCSTEGWSINNVLLDLSGGLLSFAQVGLNAFARGDISVITGVWSTVVATRGCQEIRGDQKGPAASRSSGHLRVVVHRGAVHYGRAVISHPAFMSGVCQTCDSHSTDAQQQVGKAGTCCVSGATGSAGHLCTMTLLTYVPFVCCLLCGVLLLSVQATLRS